MLSINKLSRVYCVLRQASSIAVREAQPTKFMVKDGKFIRVSEKVPTVSEEVTHTGQVSLLIMHFFHLRKIHDSVS